MTFAAWYDNLSTLPVKTKFVIKTGSITSQFTPNMRSRARKSCRFEISRGHTAVYAQASDHFKGTARGQAQILKIWNHQVFASTYRRSGTFGGIGYSSNKILESKRMKWEGHCEFLKLWNVFEQRKKSEETISSCSISFPNRLSRIP